MTTAFNLLDEPWIPVQLTNGEFRDVGLLELFEDADRVQSLAETSPPNLIALYRILLAITHRALTMSVGQWRDADRAEWCKNGFPEGAIRSYLERSRERFWLFHPEWPFMQVADLARAKETSQKYKPWTHIALGCVSGNAPVVFDHALDAMPKTIAPAYAIRCLLGYLQFTPGGLVKVLRTSDKAGPLANSAAVIAQGSKLKDTLLLNLHPCSGDVDTPFWERTEPLRLADLRMPPGRVAGTNDRYSRLSRAVLLDPVDSLLNVQQVRFAAGQAMEDDPSSPDPMVSYRIGEGKSTKLTFREGRATWRELPALLPDRQGRSAHPAAVLDWAIGLYNEINEWDESIPVLVAGLCSDQAKLLRWRSDTIRIVGNILADSDKVDFLRDKIQQIEALFVQLRSVLVDLVALTFPDPAHKDTRSKARALIDTGPAAGTYFAFAECSLAQLMHQTASEHIDEADCIWQEVMITASLQAWQVTSDQLGGSPKVWRAEAKMRGRLNALLSPLWTRLDELKEETTVE